VCVFRAMSSAPGSGALTITYPSSQSNATWIVSQWTGVDGSGTNGSGAIAQNVSARGDAVTTLSTTLAAFADPNDVAYGIVGVGLNGPAVTQGAVLRRSRNRHQVKATFWRQSGESTRPMPLRVGQRRRTLDSSPSKSGLGAVVAEYPRRSPQSLLRLSRFKRVTALQRSL